MYINEQRQCGGCYEGHGEARVFWPEYEIKCYDCGKWTADYGDVDLHIDEGQRAWICHDCWMAYQAEEQRLEMHRQAGANHE